MGTQTTRLSRNVAHGGRSKADDLQCPHGAELGKSSARDPDFGYQVR
jgi:hypothetical protein